MGVEIVEACWLQKLVLDFQICSCVKPTVIYEDNQSSIQIAKTTANEATQTYRY